MLKYLPLVLTGIISGLIIYQSAMIAPSINKLLSTQDASTYLRFIWPKFFLIIAFLSIVGGVIIQFSNQDQSFAKIVFIVSSRRTTGTTIVVAIPTSLSTITIIITIAVVVVIIIIFIAFIPTISTGTK